MCYIWGHRKNSWWSPIGMDASTQNRSIHACPVAATLRRSETSEHPRVMLGPSSVWSKAEHWRGREPEIIQLAQRPVVLGAEARTYRHARNLRFPKSRFEELLFAFASRVRLWLWLWLRLRLWLRLWFSVTFVSNTNLQVRPCQIGMPENLDFRNRALKNY